MIHNNKSVIKKFTVRSRSNCVSKSLLPQHVSMVQNMAIPVHVINLGFFYGVRHTKLGGYVGDIYTKQQKMAWPQTTTKEYLCKGRKYHHVLKCNCNGSLTDVLRVLVYCGFMILQPLRSSKGRKCSCNDSQMFWEFCLFMMLWLRLADCPSNYPLRAT